MTDCQAGKTHLSEEFLSRLLARRDQSDAPWVYITDVKARDPEVPND